MTDNKLYLDPRTKILMIFYCRALVSLRTGAIVEITVFVVLCAITALLGYKKTAIKIAVFYIIFGIVPLLFINSAGGFIKTMLIASSALVLIMLPCFYMAYLLTKSTTVSDSIAALRKMHLPDTFVIPFAVVFRFIPTLKEEWVSIRYAMKLRGIGVSFLYVIKKPMINLEYVLIPLMMSTSNISEELAAAALSRGLAKGVKRLSIVEVKLRATDYVLIFGMPLFLAGTKVFSEMGLIV